MHEYALKKKNTTKSLHISHEKYQCVFSVCFCKVHVEPLKARG